MLNRLLTEIEFNQAYQTLFDGFGSAADRLSKMRDLDKKALKKAYRRRAQETHPDRAHLQSEGGIDPHEAFRTVVAAYELLKLVHEGTVDVALRAVVPPKKSSTNGSAGNGSGNGSAYQGFTERAKSSGFGFKTNAANKGAHARAAEERAKAWERARRQGQANTNADTHKASTSDKEQPGDSYLYNGPVPQRPLLFGQFLYYAGVITWRQLIDALVWQRRQRPLTGQLACDWGMLTKEQVREILEYRRASGQFDVPFAEYAVELGYLSAYDQMALCGRMRMLQQPLGQYFIEQGILAEHDMWRQLVAQRRHNRRIRDQRRRQNHYAASAN